MNRMKMEIHEISIYGCSTATMLHNIAWTTLHQHRTLLLTLGPSFAPACTHTPLTCHITLTVSCILQSPMGSHGLLTECSWSVHGLLMDPMDSMTTMIC